MKKCWIWTLFILMVIAQLAVPASMIYTCTTTLRQGSLHKFQCRPVDPYDAFRGRYVRLGFTASDFSGTIPNQGEFGNTYYALLGKDEAGYAIIKSLSDSKPEQGDFITIHRRRNNWGWRNGRIPLPFNRYYMEEFSAPEAERVVRDQGAEDDAYVTVRIYKGNAVLEELFINGVPIREYLLQQSNAQ